MSQAFLAFTKITPEHIKNFSLQEALTNVGLSQGMSEQQLLKCNWHVSMLKQRIDHLKRQRQYEIDRLTRQNETLKDLQQITKLQEENKKLKEIIRVYEAQPNRRKQDLTRREQDIARREQDITRREQGITRREQDLTRREQELTRREQAVTRREQAISQENPFYLKCQFLVGYALGLVGNGISLALGWKKQDEPGYPGLLAGFIIGAIFTLVWLYLLARKVYIECKESTGSIGIIDMIQSIGNDKYMNDLDDKYSTRYIQSY